MKYSATQWKVVALRETPLSEMPVCDTPASCADYWRTHIANSPDFDPSRESLYVLHLNTRRRLTGFNLVAHGLIDTILVDARSVFRAAVIANASAIVLMHNHPSGESTPSEADVKVTRDMIRGGQLLKIDVLDHVVMGQTTHASLKEQGYFYN